MTKTKVWIVDRKLEDGAIFGSDSRTVVPGRVLAVDERGSLRVVWEKEGRLSIFDPFGTVNDDVEIVG